MERPTEAIKRLSECVSHDACDAERCAYFGTYEELRAVMAWVDQLEAQIKELEGRNQRKSIEIPDGEWLAMM